MPLGGLQIQTIQMSRCPQRSFCQPHIWKNEQSYLIQKEQVMCWITVPLLTITATLFILLLPIDGVMGSHSLTPTMAALAPELSRKVVDSHYKIGDRIFL